MYRELAVPAGAVASWERPIEEVVNTAFADHPTFHSFAWRRRISRAVIEHAERDGYACRLAFHDDRLIAFGYGFRSFAAEPPDAWYAAVVALVGPRATDEWIRGQFEIPWMGIDPTHQRSGLGARLVQDLLDDGGRDRAWVVTDPGTPGAAFCRRMGWILLGEGRLARTGRRLVFGRERRRVTPTAEAVS